MFGSDDVGGERLVGRVGPGRTRPRLGAFGLLAVLVGGIVVAAVVGWRNLRSGEPPASDAPSAGSSASAGPDASKPGASAIPSPTATFGGPVVEPVVVDRPGVPAALYDKYWAALGQVGQVGTTARMVMPSNEWILGADAGRVASYIIDTKTYSPVVGPEGVTVIVRDLRSGAVIRTFETESDVSEGLMTGSLLFWIGRSLPLEAQDRIDAGVWVIDLDDPASIPHAIVPASDLAAKYGPRATRGLLKLTDRGRAVSTFVESDTTRATEVIEIASLSVATTLDEFAIEVVDGLAVIAPLHKDTGDPSRSQRIRVVELATGSQVGPGVETDLVRWSALGASEVFVQFGRGADSYITALSLDSGKGRDIRIQLDATETMDLSQRLSAPDVLVLVPGGELTLNSEGKVLLPVTLLDPATGDLQQDAFTIGDP